MQRDPGILALAHERLRRAYESGRREFPDVHLAFDVFERYARRALPKVETGDYYLAVACDQGLPGAWEQLQKRYRRPLHAMMRRRGARGREVDELLDDVWGRLAEPATKSEVRTRLGTYDGRSPLLPWLVTVGWRLLTDRWRRAAGVVSSERPVEAQQQDPTEHIAGAEMEQLVADVLERAWESLTTRELEVVVLKYRHRLPQTEIARRLRVTPGRITHLLRSSARRLRRAVDRRYELRAYVVHAESNHAALLALIQRMLNRSDIEGAQPDVEERGAG